MPLCTGCQEQAPAPVPIPTAQQAVPAVEQHATAPTISTDNNTEILEKKGWASLQRGLDWLLAQQAEDGGWHSKTYGPFKGGAATTALVLYAASQLPVDLRCAHTEAWQRGWKFLERGVQKKGFVVCPDGTMDEPVYATALVLLAQHRLQLGIKSELLTSMDNFLLNERCGKERGFKPDDPNYGGWDLAGGTGLGADTPGSNVSITRFVVESLPHELRDPDFDSVLLAWAKRVQNLPGDGGFFFHPQRDHDGNKAQWADSYAREKPRSYGTATCDGVLLLYALGWTPQDAPLKEALAWWLSNSISTFDRVPGFEDAPPETGWQEGLLFYYLMTSSQVLKLVDRYAGAYRWAAIIEKLHSTQHADGRWQNESARMREDDPLIATSFAVVALSNLLKYQSAESSEKP